MRFLIIFIYISLTYIKADENIKALQYSGIEISYKGKSILIERKQNGKCLDIPIVPKVLYSENNRDMKIPKECKKTIFTSLGILQPISLDKDIRTVGELEVLNHIKKAKQDSERYIIIDARKANWYRQLTIPTAVNLPYDEIEYDEDFKEDFEHMLKILNIKRDKNGLDFSNAKEAILFCNGSWCIQSSRAIFKLIELGYPKDRLMWYRGGIQDWLSYGMTILKNP